MEKEQFISMNKIITKQDKLQIEETSQQDEILNKSYNNLGPQQDLINNYTKEEAITYKGERYSVRDNGAIMRHSLPDSKPRKLDNTWTFGKKDKQTGYMMYGRHRVHIIIANAFHGEHDSKQYVVDHIDTNRCNNRVENLRWFTKLENALNNPVTLQKITLLCGGDINNFLENPSCLKDLTGNYQDVTWMRTVTKEEARNAYEHVMNWVKNPSKSPSNGPVGEWIYKPFKPFKEHKNTPNLDSDKTPIKTHNYDYSIEALKKESDDDFEYLTKSLTPNVLQRYWNTPTKFPLCPNEIKENGLELYFQNLEIGKEFCLNKLWKSTVFEFAISNDNKTIWVVCDNGTNSPKRWGLTGITIERGYYVHTTIGTFFEQNGVMKAFTLSQGKEWEGEDSIDDYL